MIESLQLAARLASVASIPIGSDIESGSPGHLADMAQYGAASAQNGLSPASPVTPSHHASTASGLAALAQGHALAAANTPSAASDATVHVSAAAAAAAALADPSSAAAQLASQHKRVYQACIPCRRRKVRCDLGSVDNPHEPPCVRCRRESKECYFSATRRKRKTDDPAEDDLEQDDYIVRNGRKQVRLSEPVLDRRLYSEVPLTPGGGHGRSKPLRRPGDEGYEMDTENSERDSRTVDEDEPNTQLENLEAQSVMRREVYGPHDALDLLYKAATNK